MLGPSKLRLLTGLNVAAILTLTCAGAAHAETRESAPANASRPNDNLRLATVGYRLARSNADLCDEHRMMSGLLVHDIASYAESDRAVIARHYGLDKGFGVLDLVPDSAAARAGFERGDEILAVAGTPMDTFALDRIGKTGSYDRVDGFKSFLSNALMTGGVDVSIRRAGKPMTLHLVGDPGCGGQFTVMLDRKLNAWTDGRFVAVTTRMMELAETDDQLAFVVAHEMSHNILDHTGPSEPRKTIFSPSSKGKTRDKAPASSSRSIEIAADDHAVAMVLRAGYDIEGATKFLQKAGRIRWYDIPIGHPGIGRRIKVVTLAAARFDEEQRQAPLLPEIRLASAEIAGSTIAPSGTVAGSMATKLKAAWEKPRATASLGEIRIADFVLGANALVRAEDGASSVTVAQTQLGKPETSDSIGASAILAAHTQPTGTPYRLTLSEPVGTNGEAYVSELIAEWRKPFADVSATSDPIAESRKLPALVG